jgi:hypothetical protein
VILTVAQVIGSCSEDGNTLLDDWALVTTRATGSLETIRLWEFSLSEKIQIAIDIASGKSFVCGFY